MTEDLGYTLKPDTLKNKLQRYFLDGRDWHSLDLDGIRDTVDDLLAIINAHTAIAYQEPPICTEIRLEKAFNGG